MTAAIVVFTRDLRVSDNPALHAAATGADEVVPLFVLDRDIMATDYNRPNRARFLAESLADLDCALRRLGSRLVVRHGDVAEQVAGLADETAAGTVHLARDYSRYARRRQERIAERLTCRRELHLHDSHVVVPPGSIRPSGGDGEHFSVFTPYFNRWIRTPHRDLAPTPSALSTPPTIASEPLPSSEDVCPGDTSPELLPGGETAARRRAKQWYDGGVATYSDHHDALARDDTSRLSPYLHFGCISPVELLIRADRRRSGVTDFVRQLCWRDFHHQVLAARPDAATADYRTRHDRWRRDADGFRAWQEGRTGYPIVDAGMRQLRREGWMHNRARLITGSFLAKHLYVDWRLGAGHFFDLLVDGDIANNTLNWQWIAGTGTDSRPNRVLNPVLQAQRYDADGRYVRRYVEELRGIDGAAVHQPWRLDPPPEGYPAPIVDHAEAVRAFRAARAARTRA